MASDRYRALATAAAQHGDIDGTLKMTLKSYANVPDGQEMKLDKLDDGRIQLTRTDQQSGKVTQQVIATPDQILSYASKGAFPSFDQLVVASAADRAQIKKPKGVVPGYKPKDMNAVDESMGTETDNGSKAELQKQASSLGLSADETTSQVGELKSMAVQLRAPGVNANMNNGDALKTVMELTRPGDKKFTYTKTDAGDAVKVKLSNGATVTIPDELMPRLAKLRAAYVAAAAKTAEANKASAARTQQNVDAFTKAIAVPPANPQAIADRKSQYVNARRGYALPVGEDLNQGP
jgi:hypothetical protein